MQRYFSQFSVNAEQYTIWIDLHDACERYTVPIEVPFIFPTDMVAAIYDGGFTQLAKFILGEGYPGNTLKYWDNALRCTWGKKHPDLQDTSREVLGVF